MSFCKVYATEGPQARKIESTDEGTIREMMTKKKNGDDGDDVAVGMAMGGAVGAWAVS